VPLAQILSLFSLIPHRQIACSDVILLNKTDLVSESRLVSLESLIHNINPVATVHRTTRSNIDLKFIMGIDAYASRVPDPPHAHDHEGSCEPDKAPKATHYTIRGISSILVPISIIPSSRVEKLDEWIRSLLWDNKLLDFASETPGLEVLRCKGMFRTDANETYVLQGVREMYDLTKLEDETGQPEGVGDVGKLVFIGKGLNEAVRNSLENLVNGR
jgi:G3E family GTPase